MAAVFNALHSFLCATALAVSGYALHVSYSNEKDEDYEAMCDISQHMSCSSVLTSRRAQKFLKPRKYLCFFVLRYSKGFGVLGDILGDDHPLNISNSIYGIAFYICVTFLGNYRNLGRTFCIIVVYPTLYKLPAHTHTTHLPGFIGSKTATLLAVAGGLIGAIDFLYLAYIMVFILKDLCLVCLTLYAIHSLLLLLHLHHYCTIVSATKQKEKGQ